MKKISFLVNKDISDHPHFHRLFLELVVGFEKQKDIFCKNCSHSRFNHVIGTQGNSYCQICYKKGNECKKFIPKLKSKKEVKNG